MQIAVAKLNEAEHAKEEMESELKRKEQELQKRTGTRFQSSRLAGAEDVIRMNVSHRGPGAFPRADMTWRRKVDATPTPAADSNCPSTSSRDEQVPVQRDAVAASDHPGTQPTETTEDTPPDATWEDRRPADDRQSDEQQGDGDIRANNDEQVPVEHDAVAAGGHPGTQPTETTDDRPPDATWEDRRPADDRQSEEQPGDDDIRANNDNYNNDNDNDNDETQQLQPPPSAPGISDHLVTAST